MMAGINFAFKILIFKTGRATFEL